MSLEIDSEFGNTDKTTSSINIRIYYEDTDSGGVVYYANYLKFIERGRTEYLLNLGFEQDKLSTNEGVIFAVKSVTADYLLPARLNDQLQVTTVVTKTRRASIVFLHKIVNLKKNKVLFKAQVIVACLNVKSFKPRSIPSEILEKING
ncbi:MAG TPA: tol-pal system-associated acyl-CoA thioesterase [Candidatus Thioglobus sp.]|jgi:acyl-CoA thioester hydrolase|nr:tol-pal system-associated acyl-CoA thioesterase [Candidatus Thioglobus sp.]HIL42048.1 tol-pal system-associated acyl-CoA thioesterase [Gammaproteobacteria bacterium]